jgi:hypothetical protein
MKTLFYLFLLFYADSSLITCMFYIVVLQFSDY